MKINYKGLVNTHIEVESTISTSSHPSWSPPTSSIKLNINASRPVDNTWGVGAIVRDYDGFVLATTTWNFESLLDANIAEALRFR